MLGDSGVGKTSLLVYYQTGKFRSGSFAATIGIALTVSRITHNIKDLGNYDLFNCVYAASGKMVIQGYRALGLYLKAKHH